MLRKFRHELHANEIVLLAYYVAAVNIEATFQELTQTYEPFPGIVLTDTFQSSEEHDQLDGSGVFEDNNNRVVEQNQLPLTVIVGNPPYSAGQSSANDENQNLKYPTLDKRIEATYAAQTSVSSKRTLYDSYIRAIRWASDRIGDRGVVAYVSNGGFLDDNSAEGIRKCMQDEFSTIYLLNLRGNQRTLGEQSRKEGGKVFGSGSRATIVVYLLVKNPDAAQTRIWYHDIGDYLSRDEKLDRVSGFGSVASVGWRSLGITCSGDWITRRTAEFSTFPALGSKPSSPGNLLATYSLGLATGRDAWAYGSSATAVEQNIRQTIEFYNSQVDANQHQSSGDEFALDRDATRFSWNRNAEADLARGKHYAFQGNRIYTSAYRPFTRQSVYFESQLNAMTYQLPRIFPSPGTENWGFSLTGPGNVGTFSTLAYGDLPCLDSMPKGQFFPRYTYAKTHTNAIDVFDSGDEYERIDNVTHEVLVDYQARYGQTVAKDDIFFFIYGFLHSPDYRERYASDLKKMLPRIPRLEHAEDFWSFTKAGRALSELHLNYESVEHYPVELEWSGLDTSPAAATRPAAEIDPALLRVEKKMKYDGKAGAEDMTVLRYNEYLTIRGIPLEAQEYMLGSRSALGWIIDRYYVRTDKKSGIVNDANKWGEEHGNPRYILDLIQSIITVSVKTVEIVNDLPPLRISSEYDAKS